METSTFTGTRRAERASRWPERARGRVRVLAGAVLAIAVVTLVGWLAHLDVLVRWDRDLASMKVNTALAFAALSLACLVDRSRVRRIAAGTVLVLALAIVADHASGVGLGLGELLVDDWTSGAAASAGRPALTTAVALIALSAATLLRRERRSPVPQLLASASLIMGLVAVYGYMFDAASLYGTRYDTTMSLPTAISLVVLSVASLLAEPRGALQWISFGRDPGAALQRFLIPLTLVVLPVAALVLVDGQRSGRFGLAFAWALLIVITVGVVIAIGLGAGQVARAIDDDRERLVAELHEANQELEDRVRMRSHQLNRQRTKLVLLEERDRIARDLHDRVIQRIFAAGLQIAGLSRAQHKLAVAEGRPDPALVDSLNGVAAELDLAIRELRNSIFELTSVADHDNLEQMVREVASRASRILGFMPRVEVTGQVADVQPELVAQLASVMQEGLSNVARHAQASSAELSLHVSESELEVRISDDGLGMPEPLPRSSGISNLISRARNLGGSASWTPNDPVGTVMFWTVPRDGDPRPEGYGNVTAVTVSDRVHSAAASSAS
ncbi:MAG TPA: histidine kinase [Marmoricola sp.]|nr:histidine kinase [Marmoricola sp.]